jgi:5'-methylthioadenosine phosphorylase
MQSQILGVIGGTGLYDMPGLRDVESVAVDTPYGPPSDPLLRARLEGSEQVLLFLPRHGRGHRVPPHAINYRANVCALKMLGATHLLSVSAVGSMREHIAPGDMVVVDQFVDLTKRRISTFFDEGVVGHVSLADPVCPILAEAVHQAIARARDAARELAWGRTHRGGTYLCIEGPQFSTRAESRVYRSWGVDLIGMTNMPEAKLAREAELPYSTIALVTDFDCWHESEDAVDVEAVIRRLGGMVDQAKVVVRQLAGRLPDVSHSPARGASSSALMTALEAVPQQARERLAWLLPDLGGMR